MNTVHRSCIAALAALCAFSAADVPAGENAASPKKILCSTFPMYQLARNIVDGSGTATVDLMIPAAMGCPHDYALTPRDMEKIAAADILIVNGLGMEEFIGKSVELANPDIEVVDSSLGARDVIASDDDNHRLHGEDGPSHGGVNPHLFTSPAASAFMAETIAQRLCVLDSASAALYAENAAAYSKRLRKLAGEMAGALRGAANNRIVEPHGAFDYLARDLGLEIAARLQPHGQALSAARMLEVLEVIRETKPAAIVVEPQYPTRIGETLAAETGLPVVELDPAANGPENAPLDYYETVMRSNLSILGRVLNRR